MRNGRKLFHPREFVGNNIGYRIASSAALAKYKESQSFILNQLAFNPFHKFSRSAKEILLFKYDIWFDFINEVEQYLLIHIKDLSSASSKDILELADIRVKYYEETLRKQKNLIDSEYFEVWSEGHLEVQNHFMRHIKVIFDSDLKAESLIASISDSLVKVLNHTLYELHELDTIFFSDTTPVFNLDDLSCEIEDGEERNCLIYKRMKKLQEVRPFKEVIIKNYLSDKVPFIMTKLHTKLKENNIKYTLV